MTHLRPTRSAERRQLFWILAAVFLVGLVFVLLGVLVEPQQGIMGRLLYELGLALTISAIVALTVERYLRESTYDEMATMTTANLDAHRKESIDVAYFQRVLHPDISELVRRTIMEVAVIEKDVTCKYDMTAWDVDGKHLLRTEITRISTLENATEQTHTTTWEERSSLYVPEGAPAEDTGFKEVAVTALAEDDTKFADAFDLRGKNIDPYVSRKRGYRVFGRELRLPANSRVKTSLREVCYFNVDDWETVCATRPTVNMKVEVRVPPGQFTFSGEPDHPLEANWMGSVDDENGFHCWQINGGILHSQGIRFEWKPNSIAV